MRRYLTGVKDEDGEEVGVIDQFNNWNNSYKSINFMIDDKNIYEKLLTHVYKFKFKEIVTANVVNKSFFVAHVSSKL